jgi:hypothetical protein
MGPQFLPQPEFPSECSVLARARVRAAHCLLKL